MMLVRRLLAEDLPELAGVFAGSPYNKPWMLFEQYRLEQSRGLRDFYIATIQSAIVGYCTLVWQSPYGVFAQQQIPEIKDLNVLVGYRRKGFARQMINYSEEVARGRGHQVIGLGVGSTSDSDPARALYLSLGYEHDGNGLQPDEWGGAEYLTKKL